MHSALYLFAGIVLLCWPTAWSLRKSVHFFPIGNFLSQPVLWADWLLSVAWWNLPRAWAGVWCLGQAQSGFFGAEPGNKIMLVYTTILLIAGLAMQLAFFPKKETEVHVPLSYFAGVMLATLPLGVALPALVLGVATAIGARSLAIGWATGGATVAVLGYLLSLPKTQVLAFGLLVALPLALVIGSNRQFVLPARMRLSLKPEDDAYASRLR